MIRTYLPRLLLFFISFVKMQTKNLCIFIIFVVYFEWCALVKLASKHDTVTSRPHFAVELHLLVFLFSFNKSATFLHLTIDFCVQFVFISLLSIVFRLPLHTLSAFTFMGALQIIGLIPIRTDKPNDDGYLHPNRTPGWVICPFEHIHAYTYTLVLELFRVSARSFTSH